MWTRRASKPKVQGDQQQHELDPEIRAKVEAASAPPPPALDDSQYGVRSFEFGGEPRPIASQSISIALDASSMQERQNDSDSDSINTELEHEHETPMPAMRELQAESPPRYSPHLASTNLEMPSESGITARVDIGTVDERIGEALAGAMRDTYRTREDGEAEEDNTSDLTVHPAAPILTAGITLQAQIQPQQHSRPATPVHVHALSSPIFAAHSPNPSLVSGASASGMDTDLDLEHDHYDFDSDLSSAPPSPTSLTSLPSYVASLSSASRSSSPPGLGYSSGTGSGVGGTAEGAIAAAVARARQRGRGGEEQGHGQAAELVIPELSLPSSSLHLSLRDWEGPVKGVKVVLLGPAELTKRVIRAIGEREECVNVRHEGRGKGVVGVVRDGEMLGVVETGVTAEQARIRLLRTYTTLHGLLNPASQDEAQLGEVVRAYSAREDWIHAVVGVHTASRHQAESLSHLVPVLDTGTSTTSTPDSPLGGPTPMPRTVPSSSYFDNPIIRSLGNVGALADSIIFALSPSPSLSTPSTRSRSVSTFLAWRPPALSSSNSSLDSRGHAPTSATSTSTSGMDMDADPAHLMPTVARAQGGGEWEATLSRRLAQRRGSQAQAGLSSAGLSGAEGAGSGGGGGGTRDRDRDRDRDGTTKYRPGSRRSSNDAKRRRSLGKGKQHSVEPLFPPRPVSPARDAKSKLHPKQELSNGRLSRRPGCMPEMGLGLGVGKLVSSTFKNMGTWTKGWRGAVLAAVVVGVVGLRLYFWQ